MAGYTIRNQQGLHFLTFTIVGWVDVFTRKEYRDIILDSFRYCQEERSLVINGYVVMSNHIHLIARSGDTENLSNIIRDFKKFTSRTILKAIENGKESRKKWMLQVFAYHAKYNSNNRKYQFWLQNNHPIELASPKWILQKLDYVHLNPVRANLVAKSEEYLYSSASNYATGNGLIDVDVLDLGVTIGYLDV